MATNLDNRVATFETENLILANDELSTEPWAEALIENAGFAAYLPRMVASQQDLVTAPDNHWVEETRKAYFQAGTYDVYAAMRCTFTSAGSQQVTVNGTTVLSGSFSAGWNYGSSVGFVVTSGGWFDVAFRIYGAGTADAATCSFGAVYARFVDASF